MQEYHAKKLIIRELNNLLLGHLDLFECFDYIMK